MKRCVAVAVSALLVVGGCGGTSDEGATEIVGDGVAERSVEATSTPHPTPSASPGQNEETPQEEAVGADAPDVPDSTQLDSTPEESSAEPADSEAPPNLPDRWTLTPLSRYWGFADLSSDEFWAMRFAEEHEINELVAVCMADQGFEYIPWVPPLHEPLEGAELSDEEYRQKYGYGTTPMIDEVHPTPAADDRPENPNSEIQEAMSPGERAAYDRAMHGDQSRITESTPLEERGCWGRADLAVRGQEYALHDLLGDEQRALRQRIENDPRVVEATVEWSRCMSEAGFAYGSPDEAREDIGRRSEPFQMRGDPYEVLTAEEIDAMTPAELEAVVVELMVLPPEQQAELEALQQYELAVAAADYECGLPLDDVRYEATVELEQQFVDEHLATLEAIVASR